MAGRGDRYYTYTELLAIARRFRQNPNELMISWILRVYDQGGQALSCLLSHPLGHWVGVLLPPVSPVPVLGGGGWE